MTTAGSPGRYRLVSPELCADNFGIRVGAACLSTGPGISVGLMKGSVNADGDQGQGFRFITPNRISVVRSETVAERNEAGDFVDESGEWLNEDGSFKPGKTVEYNEEDGQFYYATQRLSPLNYYAGAFSGFAGRPSVTEQLFWNWNFRLQPVDGLGVHFDIDTGVDFSQTDYRPTNLDLPTDDASMDDYARVLAAEWNLFLRFRVGAAAYLGNREHKWQLRRDGEASYTYKEKWNDGSDDQTKKHYFTQSELDAAKSGDGTIKIKSGETDTWVDISVDDIDPEVYIYDRPKFAVGGGLLASAGVGAVSIHNPKGDGRIIIGDALYNKSVDSMVNPLTGFFELGGYVEIGSKPRFAIEFGWRRLFGLSADTAQSNTPFTSPDGSDSYTWTGSALGFEDADGSREAQPFNMARIGNPDLFFLRGTLRF